MWVRAAPLRRLAPPGNRCGRGLYSGGHRPPTHMVSLMTALPAYVCCYQCRIFTYMQQTAERTAYFPCVGSVFANDCFPQAFPISSDMPLLSTAFGPVGRPSSGALLLLGWSAVCVRTRPCLLRLALFCVQEGLGAGLKGTYNRLHSEAPHNTHGYTLFSHAQRDG